MSSAYNPNKQGWGFATVVCILTAGLFFTAKTIHERTYRHPRDPMATQVYHERDAAKHEAPAGDTHAPAASDAGHNEPAKPEAAKPGAVKH